MWEPDRDGAPEAEVVSGTKAETETDDQTIMEASCNMYRTWMENLFEVLKDRKLFQLTLPGTHDSGAYELSRTRTPGSRSSIPQWVEFLRQYAVFHGVIDQVIVDFSLTQSVPIGKQLDGGIRYLDLRICLHDGNFHVHHGLVGPSLSEIFAELQSFMCSVTRELVIVHASHFSAVDTPASHQAFTELILKYLDDYLITPQEYASVEELRCASFGTLVDKGPRVIFIYDDVYLRTNPSPHFWPGRLVYSHWANTTDMEVLAHEQAAQLATCAGCEQRLFVLQWISSPQVSNLQSAALGLLNPFRQGCSPTLLDLCKDGPCQQLRKFVDERKEQINVIMVDFFEHGDVLEICTERCLVYQ